MRVTCLIDSLGSGGAQRQMALLAGLLHGRGHGVRVVCYHDLNFFERQLTDGGVSVEVLKGKKWLRPWMVAGALRRSEPDVVISFLDSPNLLAEVAGIPRRRWKLIVSERSLDLAAPDFRTRIRLLMHRCADRVICNSHAQAEYLIRHSPALRRKVATIWNCVDLETFRPAPGETVRAAAGIRMVVVGHLAPWKNAGRLAEALQLVTEKQPGHGLSIDWYGDYVGKMGGGEVSTWGSSLNALLGKLGVADRFRVHGRRENVVEIYQGADCVCLPSLFEGCPNVICEAMACGKPIVASGVGDIPRMVDGDRGGYLFDPNSVPSIAAAMERVISSPRSELESKGANNLRRAQEQFSLPRFGDAYEGVMFGLVKGGGRA